ncbi:integral membrane protein [Beauveria brongniartii RCEF 3172]|uniref:Integral membrane protein n=1 Tax=Beauveria brongniartii RCEF 3172 TaxID=1081107 RepID=A0A166WKN0_9HYPO|nr:integral membrane protein [Beauveria brongniartii RCEF 3172]
MERLDEKDLATVPEIVAVQQPNAASASDMDMELASAPPTPPPPHRGTHPHAVLAKDHDATEDASGITEIGYQNRVRLAKDHASGAYTPVLEQRFRNNLRLAVGFLELANAGDFAANVWNQIPVPVYAIVCMAIGATGAGVLSFFAFDDARYSWRNVVFLRRQRAQLKETLQRRESHGQSSRDVRVLLELNLRELGCETINRFGMDVLMGFGAVLICIGTYMAIGGANKKVWLTSNILSGYLGNAPIALYGLVNSGWATYLAIKTEGHVKATARALPGSLEYRLVKERAKKLQLYCGINGAITLVGGVASMLTATQWWAYVILIPVIVLSFTCNWFWRTRLGYSHDDMRQMPDMDVEKLSKVLRFAAEARTSLARNAELAERDLVLQAATLAQALDLIDTSGLLEAFSINVVSDSRLCYALCDPNAEQVEVSLADIAALPYTLHPALLEAAHDCLRSAGVSRYAHLERFSAELLGIYLHQSQSSADLESARK